jgi:hypothetical protein
MPVYLTQWRDGDLTLVSADSLEEAMKVFDQTACLDEVDVVELKTPHLSVTLTLAKNGDLRLPEYTPAIEEAKQVCFPRVMEALQGLYPGVDTDPAHLAELAQIVEDEQELREISKLSERLRREVE